MPVPPPIPVAEAMRLRARRDRLRRRILIGVWGVPLFFLACALYFAFGPKPPPTPHPLPVSPQEVATASQHIDAVRAALTQAQDVPVPDAPVPVPPPTSPSRPRSATSPGLASHAAPAPEEVTLRVSQADLNAYVTGSTRLKTLLEARGVHAVTVDLEPPADVTIHAAATFRGISGNAMIAATLTPDQRTALHLDITEARFARFPPPIIKAAADAILGQVLNRPNKTLPVTIRSVRVIGTDLVITETHSPPPANSP